MQVQELEDEVQKAPFSQRTRMNTDVRAIKSELQRIFSDMVIQILQCIPG